MSVSFDWQKRLRGTGWFILLLSVLAMGSVTQAQGREGKTPSETAVSVVMCLRCSASQPITLRAQKLDTG